MNTHFQIKPGDQEWPIFARDIGDVPNETTRLRIGTDTTGFAAFSRLQQLETLWCFGIDEKKLKCIAECKSLKQLHLGYNFRASNLTCLKNLEHLEVLTIDSCSKMNTLDEICEFSNLQGLGIVNFKNIHDIEPVSRMTNLTELEVSGSIWTRMTIRSLEPLADLHKLTFLELTNTKVVDESLDPLRTLRNLKELRLSNRYPMEEFAKLSGTLTDTHCDWFKPFVKFGLPCKRCGSEATVMLTGKGTRILCENCDSEKLKRHVLAFERIAQR
jgi:hypothetical protein